MGSHSVTFHPTQVNPPRRLPASQAGSRFTYPGVEGWKAELTKATCYIYRDGLRFRDIAGFGACDPTLFHPNFGGVPVAPDRPCWGQPAHKLFSREVTSEEFQPM